MHERRVLTLSCGHHQALVANAEGEQALRRIPCRGAAIGTSRSDRIRATCKTNEIDLHPGDILVQYTDGLSEAMDAEEEEFGDLRIQVSLIANLETPDLKSVIDHVVSWAGPEQSDDYNPDRDAGCRRRLDRRVAPAAIRPGPSSNRRCGFPASGFPMPFS